MLLSSITFPSILCFAEPAQNWIITSISDNNVPSYYHCPLSNELILPQLQHEDHHIPNASLTTTVHTKLLLTCLLINSVILASPSASCNERLHSLFFIKHSSVSRANFCNSRYSEVSHDTIMAMPCSSMNCV